MTFIDLRESSTSTLQELREPEVGDVVQYGQHRCLVESILSRRDFANKLSLLERNNFDNTTLRMYQVYYVKSTRMVMPIPETQTIILPNRVRDIRVYSKYDKQMRGVGL